MKLLIISAAPFVNSEKGYYAYSPYVDELIFWQKYSDSISFCCPIWIDNKGLLVKEIPFEICKLYKLKELNFKTPISILKSFFSSIINFGILLKAIIETDHIHLRCPGNIGLLGSIVQIFFSSKIKTAKYAGNWDPNSKQPLSYKLQKWILSNTFLTKNMQVLVYGEWKNQTKNIKPFFTATYTEFDKIEFKEKSFSNGIKFLFVGTLSEGKRPIYAIQLVEKLLTIGYNVSLELFGEGVEREMLMGYIKEKKLNNTIILKGNQNSEVLKKSYKEGHFMILPSRSEGWPKAVAEAMFMGCLPVATKISCVHNMLDNGERGVLLSLDLEKDVNTLKMIIDNNSVYNEKLKKSLEWSQKFTTDKFEEEIKLLLQHENTSTN